ncbi:RagB/SusD family nutrient uptake outer membrane protein [Robiginitalea sp. M366]|uniref:RagB/SusD family nutrient uptake outer membrane protein n=1 Tax=Robiginitalea aestuariiviva TaxID=3036903 RepID=UPI00240E53E2|nr:RagB/SusD family nutrient uptake outer membrane protein [Robiginitalea aestuariiviva]MDG1571813.1 RagB/SusD family nutrient uptake outer membrane protein [Robiginitalea aestuariiviva]
MKRYLKYFSLSMLAAFALGSCTDLEIEETDSFISEGFQGLADPASALDQLYGQVYGQWADQANRYALYEVTTDALLIPTRGADWGDNGRWRKLHQHSWGLEETDILTPFDQYNANQLLASQILDTRSGASPQVAAEAHFLRAYNMFTILDLFGQVPFRDTQLPSSAVPEVLTGADAVNFILADLDAAISGLPSVQAGTGDLTRASQAAARLLKAKVLLNRHIFNNQLDMAAGGAMPSADAGDMQEVISLVDQITADGYALESGYFDIFRSSADTETIWWGTAGVGNRIFNGLHYNSTGLGGGGWNGFSTLAEYYDLFEGDPDENFYAGDLNSAPDNGQEERRGGVPTVGVTFSGVPGTSDNGGYEDGSNVGNGFLIGQQYALDGTALTDRQGQPLVFSREFVDGDGNPNLINNDEKTGIRVMKYNPRFGGGFEGHNLIFRYADAYLMKAEAMLRLGQDPTAMVNDLRVIRGATPLGSVTESDLLDERGRELYIEGWRRNDMVRFGQYLRNWEFKEDTSSKRLLFPIPLPQLLANPNLQQNPGY